jgi:hypothetical protein
VEDNSANDYNESMPNEYYKESQNKEKELEEPKTITRPRLALALVFWTFWSSWRLSLWPVSLFPADIILQTLWNTMLRHN